jgi:hypothetical protein
LAAINSNNKLKTKVVSFLPSSDDERISFAAADAVSTLSFGNLGVETDENDVDVFQAEIEKRNFEDMLQEAHRTVRAHIFVAILFTIFHPLYAFCIVILSSSEKSFDLHKC